jgi:hypothetical protein
MMVATITASYQDGGPPTCLDRPLAVIIQVNTVILDRHASVHSRSEWGCYS